jgi:CTP:molybdopterin cytidylyltransferase MocA
MTVAAVILAASVESALADVEGQPRVRRLVDAAWSGGAIPIIVVAPDPDGGVKAALSGASVTLAEPAPMELGPAAQMARGLMVAADAVRGIDAGLVWPARMVWVGPETITSLIEAHGVDRATILRPSFDGEAGWPVLVPMEAVEVLNGLAPDRMPDVIIDDLEAALGAVRPGCRGRRDLDPRGQDACVTTRRMPGSGTTATLPNARTRLQPAAACPCSDGRPHAGAAP